MKPLMANYFPQTLQQYCQQILITTCFIALTCLSSSESFAANSATKHDAGKKHSGKSNTVAEISIIGNTELPNVSFNLPWRLPSVAKRAEQSPVKSLDNMLVPIEPDRHRKMVFFSEHLELDVPKLNGQQ